LLGPVRCTCVTCDVILRGKIKIATRVIINLSSKTCGAALCTYLASPIKRKHHCHLSNYFIHVDMKEDHSALAFEAIILCMWTRKKTVSRKRPLGTDVA
jgi:hypothetical protein